MLRQAAEIHPQQRARALLPGRHLGPRAATPPPPLKALRSAIDARARTTAPRPAATPTSTPCARTRSSSSPASTRKALLTAPAPRAPGRARASTRKRERRRPSRPLILAAGKGTRMKSARAKVLHPSWACPLLEHVLRAVQAAGAAPVTVVVGHQAEAVEAAFAGRGLALRPPGAARSGPATPCRSPASASPPIPTARCWWSTATCPCCARRRCAALLDAHRERRRRGHAAHRRARRPRRLRARAARTRRAACAPSWRPRTPPPRRRACARSTPASTPSRCPRCSTCWAGCSRRTPRASTT